MQSETSVARGKRFQVNVEFESVRDFVREYITNLSNTGAFVRSTEPAAVGSPVDLRFSILADQVEILEGSGVVVRVSQDPPGMGIVFTDLTPESEQLLRRILPRALDMAEPAFADDCAAGSTR